MFTLLLMGYIAHQAANGQRISSFLALAEAQLQLENAAVRGVVAQGGAVHHLTIESTAEECRNFSSANGAKKLIE